MGADFGLGWRLRDLLQQVSQVVSMFLLHCPALALDMLGMVARQQRVDVERLGGWAHGVLCAVVKV
jgi:hypothetical protein